MCLLYSRVFLTTDYLLRRGKYFLSLNQLNKYMFFWSEWFLSWAVVYLDLMSLFLFPDLEADGKSFHRFQVQPFFSPPRSTVALTLREFNFAFWNYFKFKENQGMTDKNQVYWWFECFPWSLIFVNAGVLFLWACHVQLLIPELFSDCAAWYSENTWSTKNDIMCERRKKFREFWYMLVFGAKARLCLDPL